jgi:hypothetical protein
MLEGLIARGRMADDDGALSLTAEGEHFLLGFGIDLAPLSRQRRPLCKGCLDWSVRRSHLAGALGAALLERIYRLGWASRVQGTRVVAFTARGEAAFAETF